MEALTIRTPADVLSFIGQTLGFRPKESLVCITLANKNNVGATLRVDLPRTDDGLFATREQSPATLRTMRMRRRFFLPSTPKSLGSLVRRNHMLAPSRL